MRDGIVDKGVYGRYANEIILLADWASVNQSDWFTEFGLKQYGMFKVALEDKNKREHQKRMKAGWIALLKNLNNVALFDFDRITAQPFMEYVSLQANQKTRKPLSNAGYCSKRSAFFHLCRVHNGMGPNALFES
jgi:hypothetical protein